MGRSVLGTLRSIPRRVDARRVVSHWRPLVLDEVGRSGLAEDDGWSVPTDDDPHLVFRAPPWGGFPTGPVMLELRLLLARPMPVDLELHLDVGAGYQEETKVVLPRTHGGRMRVVVELPAELLTVRLDLPSDVGPFDLREVRLTRQRSDVLDTVHVWRSPEDGEHDWLEKHASPTEDELQELATLAATVVEPPTFSVVLPVHDPPQELLRAAVDSVRAQAWPYWQLCVCDDASTDRDVPAYLEQVADADDRVSLVRRTENGNISAASNDALALARHRWVALLDHDDLLSPDALGVMARALLDNPGASVLYSDEDKVTLQGRRHDAYRKPEFSVELFHGQNLANHLTVVSLAAVRAVGGFRSAYDGSQDYDLLLRILEQEGPDAFRHVPQILYHWRAVAGSTALSHDEKGHAEDAGWRALEDHLARTAGAWEVEAVPGTPYRRTVPTGPTPSVQVVEVSGGVSADAALRDGEADVVVLHDGAVAGLTSEAVGLLAAHVSREEVGAAGPGVVRDDGRWYGVGLDVGRDGRARPVLHGHRTDDLGPFGRAVLTQTVDAVGGGVIALDRIAAVQVGGFGERPGLDDQGCADLCGRLAASGRTTVFVGGIEVRRTRPAPGEQLIRAPSAP